MAMKILLSVLVVFSVFSFATPRGLREEFTWTRIDYDWATRGSRVTRQAMSKNTYMGRHRDNIAFPGQTNGKRPPTPNNSNQDYIYQNNIPMGANRWRNKLFITVPRRRVGVPSTLNYVWANSTNKHNVPLIPYPNWEINSLNGDTGSNFVSVYRVAVDSCDRLWFVDTGLIETPGAPNQIQPSALVIIDLNTDRVIRRHVFNSTLLRPTTNLASLTIDTIQNQCDNSFAYIPDVGGYGLIVYSFGEDRSWRVTHNYFYLEALAGEFNIGGLNFQWNDGIFSIALSEPDRRGFRDAYFHSMAGTHLYKVSTLILRNESLATRSFHEDDFKVVGDRGDLSQTSSSDFDVETGVLFLGLVNQNALACWNVKSSLRDIAIVQKDDRRMIYPCDVKIRENDIIFLTNTMPVFLYSRLNYDETNFRVWIEKVNKAIDGTKCAYSVRSGAN